MAADIATLLFGLIALLVFFVVCIGIFLVIRQFVLWYWRINQIADDVAVIAAHYRGLHQTTTPPPLPSGYVEVPSSIAPNNRPRFDPHTGQPLTH